MAFEARHTCKNSEPSELYNFIVMGIYKIFQIGILLLRFSQVKLLEVRDLEFDDFLYILLHLLVK